MSRPAFQWRRAAFMGLGIAFSGGLYRLLFLDPAMGISLQEDFYEVSHVQAVVHSEAWRFGGFMHLLAAAALAGLAIPVRSAQDAGDNVVRVLAVISSGCFLLLGFSNLAGVPAIDSAARVCAGDGRAALVVYNLGRAVLLSASMLVLGAYLVLHSGREMVYRQGNRLLNSVGIFAGTCCLVYVLAGEAPGRVLLAAAAGVAAWGWGFAFVKPSSQ